MKLVELLAPAKDYAAAAAAVDYGADAVYIGGARFGARHHLQSILRQEQ